MIATAAVFAGLMSGLGASTATADPIVESKALLANPVSPDGSKIVKAEIKDSRNIRLHVYSAAMDENVIIDVQRPADASEPRPTLYLLNGAGGGEDDASWVARSEALDFLKDKNVNVIQPIGGKWSYYTDWIKDDPTLGRNKWTTFFTEELPPLVDGALGTNGVNAIAGLSTSGTTVLALPIAKPGLYKAAAAYSGCAQTSDPVGSEFVKLTVETWGGGNTENMWGPQGSEEWVKNDPYVNAEGLRGLELYISTGTGIPGEHDVLNGEYALPGAYGLANQVLIGGVIEAGTNYCTRNLQTKLNELGIPATFNFRPTGTHSWGYWNDEFPRSWPVLAKGLGL
ncbi:alpha/beta hydrolase [Nocardia amikacinitolerans]|uniref:S-formylglutathione hydrolase FrmB n=1 Tax=Nocardia amikacinitolerans TaxID=756689 RepID=A0A285LW33_9NOCA|nr:alpha/beta hydrolase family protein [Nocardia amikacinitolerans]MCP2280027.1 S-formylglutathione hydrolase FrmB [Nocardia amikacinitolerans]MCP2289414.1 S-formylglutathione hydrolase FrmB [Nocardia amikacinitolerans]MCP2295702.1 S-formylglutathione hydrolase FrmB [Nocardia amikacinitolerans]MCP2317477.1 S-formylglutathione hydrolase FrmB [Nocardia amikacinitolerans]SNY87856.1 S-formylglutathione hydrolase FrmB [Nocardia amikacinitolerans]